jgi:hypothetical protein
MEIFDAIHVKTPLICPTCGAEMLNMQTKELSDSMAHFKIGSLLKDSPVLTGILNETLWCSACREARREQTNTSVYLVIWHSILAGVEQDLAAVDRLDLIARLD